MNGTVEYLIVMQEGVMARLAADGHGESATNEQHHAGNAARAFGARGFLAMWGLATLLGLLTGLVAFVAVGVMAGDIIDGLPEFVFGVVLGVVFGTSFGAAQWRVLRHHLRPAAAWLGATLVGFVVGGATIFGLMNGSEPDTSLVTKLGHGLVLGASLGLAQWSVLRQHLDGAKLDGRSASVSSVDSSLASL